MLHSDDGRGLDIRADPLELAVGCRVGGAVGRRVAAGERSPERVVRSLAHAVGRSVGLGRAVRVGLRRTVSVARAARVGVQLTASAESVSRDTMEDDLVASGRFARIEMLGAQSGGPRAVTVGFVVDDATDPASALLVAAGSPETAWARNLEADPRCRVRVGDRSFDAVAEPLAPGEHARAIRELILRYGTPSEGLGRGPSFRLRPVTAGVR